MMSLVTRSEIRLFLINLATRFTRHDFARVTEYFVYPVPIYMLDDMVVVQGPDRFEPLLNLYFQTAANAGMDQFQLRGFDILDATDTRAHLTVHWQYVDKSGNEIGHSSVRYVLRRDPESGRLKVEMLEYLVLSFPNLTEQISEILAF